MLELSTYFRINQAGTGPVWTRTLVIADEESSYVKLLEAVPFVRDENGTSGSCGIDCLGPCRN
ncbi:MAG: hypothetical protein R2773_03430 [Flavobacteriaceae bacterium]